MATKTVFVDEDNNELDVYINDKGQLYLTAGNKEQEMYNGYICLDKTDVQILIKTLTELEKEME